MEKLKARAKARAEKGGFSGLANLKKGLGQARRKSVDADDEGMEMLPSMVRNPSSTANHHLRTALEALRNHITTLRGWRFFAVGHSGNGNPKGQV